MLVRFGGILVLAALAVWLYCLLDAITTDRARVRLLPKGLWVAAVLLLFVAGALAWLAWGRPRGPGPRRRPGVAPRLGTSVRTSWPAARPRSRASGPSRRPGPPAPDDDPDFLARLDRQAAQDHERLLGSWEEDLRRREEELRRDRNSDGEPDSDGEAPAPG